MLPEASTSINHTALHTAQFPIRYVLFIISGCQPDTEKEPPVSIASTVLDIVQVPGPKVGYKALVVLDR